MIKLIKNAQVYSPKYLGKKDVMMAGGQIIRIRDNIDIKGNIDIEEIDAKGMLMFPGFIDSHVHIAGGGGEGGFSTRTPEINLSQLTTAGITTVIGTLGTDGTTRTMSNLLAKARGLEEEGITTFINTGSYQVPVKTITGSIQDDIILIDKIIGAGEIAISDHRSSQPTFNEVAKIVAEARVGGMLSGKAGTVNFHLGDSERMLDLLEEIVENTEIPMKHMIPTHVNRNGYLFGRGIEYVKKGGFVDFTTSTTPKFLEEGEVECSKAYKMILDKGGNPSNVTFSSDGQGSLPLFDEKGKTIGLEIGKVSSLYEAVLDCIRKQHMTIEEALLPITQNPANIYKLKGKGQIAEGYHSDLVLVKEDTLEINMVFAKGKLMVKEGEALVKGVFER